MSIFDELLDSYAKLKKRKLIISLDEAENRMALDPQGQAKANQYISQANAKANQPPPNNRVQIPELPGTTIWVAETGKAAGRVVFDGFPGPRQGKAISVDPSKDVQNYQDFVKLFSGNPQAQDQAGGQVQGQDPTLPAGPTLSPELSKSLMKSFQAAVDLVRGNFFLHDEKTPSWMEEGPDGMFSQLAMKFTRHPGSLEMKLANSFGLMYDHNTESFIKLPVDEYDKETAAKTFQKFMSICGKFKNRTFSEEDAAWVGQHIVADKNGLWFKDPVRLDYGIAFDWQNSYTQGKDKFFTNMVESYNRAYEQWAEEKRSSPLYTIKYQSLRALPIAYRTNDLNDIRGKTAEELQVAIHHLAAGRNGQFRATVIDLKNKFGARLIEAYNYGQSFQQEQNVGTQQLAGYQELVDNLSSLAKGQVMGSNMEEGIFTSVLQRLFRIEAKGMLVRNPVSIEHVGKNVSKGAKADVVETYKDQNDAIRAAVESGFSAKEATGFIYGGNRIAVGLKTAVKPDEAKMGGGSFDNMFDSLKGKSDQGFMTKMAKDLGIFSYAPEAKVNEAIDTVQSAMDKLDMSMAKVANPKMNQGEFRKQTLDMLNGLVRKQFGFQDLISVDSFNDFDLDDEVEMDRLKNYIKRKVMAKMIRKNFKAGKKEYGAFLGLAMCSNGCAQQNQMTNVRFLSTEESLLINHNEAIQQAVRNLMEGTYKLDESDSSTLSILDDRGVPTVRMSLSRAKKNTNVATVSLSLSYLRAIAKKPNHMFGEDMMYKFLKGQKELLEGMLSSYSSKKNQSPKANKLDNSKIV